ncbi:plasmid partitioning protein RepB [Phaeobacter sp. J2-8]|uniref:plasmid partitioning protein RepB n=1 Tax=Phaeobacter sp. J2-8 TaxID=2931394 RepID=UPI001FD631C1|nr:plasmid partitioning protein RepB [Phaeobacter sp. J2-8]MCJ7873482.1 plasmid partitioning protein RepB [Phaeobacter sp. J2-8]
MARKGILTTDNTPSQRRNSGGGLAPRGAVGALQSSLSKLQENAVQDIDPHHIHQAGVVDRLGNDTQADEALKESLRIYGQQVPVLVRPRDGAPGQYDIVYGRRRVLALRDLGLPVKAMVRQLDDHALVLAQGQENTARQDLSFIEKASFAAQLDALDYDRQTIAAALSMDLPMVSRMLKVGRAFSVDFLVHIGSAPGIGRERWMKLVAAMDAPEMRDRVEARLPALVPVPTSDARFEQVLAWATGAPPPKAARPPAPPARKITSANGIPLAKVKRTESGVTVTIPAADAPGFSNWINAEADTLIQDLYDRWLKTRSED